MIRVIIPAYNEEKNIGGCIDEIIDEIKKVKKKYKIYVVDDGSTDKTSDLLLDIKREIPLEIITHKQNKGVPEAFRSGLTKTSKDSSENDIILLMEGDATSNAKLIPKILKNINDGNDIVICSRYVKGGGYRNFPLRRLLLSYLANFVMAILFPIRGVRDYTIFYRGYRPWIVKKLIKKHGRGFIKTKFYVANSEILIKMAKFNPRINEIPFVYNYGKKKKPSAMKVISNIRAYILFIYKQYVSRDN